VASHEAPSMLSDEQWLKRDREPVFEAGVIVMDWPLIKNHAAVAYIGPSPSRIETARKREPWHQGDLFLSCPPTFLCDKAVFPQKVCDL